MEASMWCLAPHRPCQAMRSWRAALASRPRVPYIPKPNLLRIGPYAAGERSYRVPRKYSQANSKLVTLLNAPYVQVD